MCSLRNVVLFFTRHLWLFFEVFSQTPFLTVVKILIQDVFSARMRSHALLGNMFVSSVWQNYNEWICLCNIIAVFPLRKLWPPFDQESRVPL